jgi:CHAT domain-containing protein
MAGSQNLLMTLWPVSDATTPFVMEDFYSDLMSGLSAEESFANAQKKWLVKLREEQGLFVAVRDAGPFAMVRMGSAKETPASR